MLVASYTFNTFEEEFVTEKGYYHCPVPPQTGVEFGSNTHPDEWVRLIQIIQGYSPTAGMQYLYKGEELGLPLEKPDVANLELRLGSSNSIWDVYYPEILLLSTARQDLVEGFLSLAKVPANLEDPTMAVVLAPFSRVTHLDLPNIASVVIVTPYERRKTIDVFAPKESLDDTNRFVSLPLVGYLPTLTPLHKPDGRLAFEKIADDYGLGEYDERLKPYVVPFKNPTTTWVYAYPSPEYEQYWPSFCVVAPGGSSTKRSIPSHIYPFRLGAYKIVTNIGTIVVFYVYPRLPGMTRYTYLGTVSFLPWDFVEGTDDGTVTNMYPYELPYQYILQMKHLINTLIPVERSLVEITVFDTPQPVFYRMETLYEGKIISADSYTGTVKVTVSELPPPGKTLYIGRSFKVDLGGSGMLYKSWKINQEFLLPAGKLPKMTPYFKFTSEGVFLGACSTQIGNVVEGPFNFEERLLIPADKFEPVTITISRINWMYSYGVPDVTGKTTIDPLPKGVTLPDCFTGGNWLVVMGNYDFENSIQLETACCAPEATLKVFKDPFPPLEVYSIEHIPLFTPKLPEEVK
jgi:hypothetical protein